MSNNKPQKNNIIKKNANKWADTKKKICQISINNKPPAEEKLVYHQRHRKTIYIQKARTNGQEGNKEEQFLDLPITNEVII